MDLMTCQFPSKCHNCNIKLILYLLVNKCKLPEILCQHLKSYFGIQKTNNSLNIFIFMHLPQRIIEYMYKLIIENSKCMEMLTKTEFLMSYYNYNNVVCSQRKYLNATDPRMKGSSCPVSSLGWHIGQQGRRLRHTSPVPGGRSTCGNRPTRSDPRQFAVRRWKCNAEEHQPETEVLSVPSKKSLQMQNHNLIKNN